VRQTIHELYEFHTSRRRILLAYFSF